VLALVDGHWCRVEVVTHIRGDRWLVEGATLPAWYRRGRWGPRRTIVAESEMRLNFADELFS
jgi:hypothetical protein